MKFFRIISSAFLIFTILFTLVFAKDILTLKDENKGVNYQGVITLWQIDAFEGGKGSRKQFLLDVSRAFEKKNKGVLVMVISHTIDSASVLIEKGEYPDLISYGQGQKVNNLREIPISVQAKEWTKLHDKVYAYPWCRGGYFLIENHNYKQKDQKMVVSKQRLTIPLLSAYLEEIEVGEFESKNSMDAYVDFVSGKYKFLLGTQRDVWRINSRGFDAKCTPITNYSDLYQYVSVTTKSDTKYELCLRFIEHLLSETEQKKLHKIGMLSAYYKVDNDISALNNLNDVNPKYSLSPYLSEVLINEASKYSIDALSGDEDAQIKLKKILIKS